MIAAKARAAAHYNTEESFNFYVDPSSGSDSNPGTKASPWASLSHAFSNMTAGQSVGFKAGTTLRVTASNQALPGAGVRVGCYGCLPGAANMPIISGGTLVTSWSSSQTGGTGGTQPTYVQSAKGFVSNGTSLAATLGSTPTVGNTLICLLTISSSVIVPSLPAGFTSVRTFDTANNIPVTVGVRTVQSGDGKTWTASYASANYGSIIVLEVTNYGGIDQFVTEAITQSPYTGASLTPTYQNSLLFSFGYSFDSGGSFTASQTASGWTTLQVESSPGFGEGWAGYDPTAPTSGTPLTGPTWGTASGGGQGAVALLNIYPANTTPTFSSTYSATLASTPSFVGWTASGTTTGLTKGSSSSGLTANQWFYSGTTLYVNLGGTNPSTGTIEAAIYRIFEDQTAGHDCAVFRGVSLRYGFDQAAALYNNTGHTFDRCDWRYVGYVADSGSIALANYTNASLPAFFSRITRCTFSFLLNDGGWSHAIPNLQVDHNTGSNVGYLVGDVQSDCWQTEDIAADGFTYHSSAGLWIHHNNFDMTGSQSPKGCILYNGFGGGPSSTVDGGLIEWNTCKGGNYGVATTASNTTVRYNTLRNQSTSFGGGIHNQNNGLQDSVLIYGNVVFGSNRSAWIVQQGTSAITNYWVVNNTFYVDGGAFAIATQSPIGLTFKNNIVWYATTAPFPIVQLYPDGLTQGTIAWDYNLIRDEGGAYYEGAGSGSSSYTTYTGLVAFRSGLSIDSHGLSSDPLFNNTAGGDFTLQSGSPAKNAGTAVTIPAGATIWGQQIPSVVIAAGGNIGAL